MLARSKTQPMLRPPAAAAPAADGPPLNTLPEFNKYAKMTKMHMPEGAIRGKMRMDGISDADMDLFFAGKGRPAATSGAAAGSAFTGPPLNTRPEWSRTCACLVHQHWIQV